MARSTEDIRLEASDPIWPAKFKKEAAKLKRALLDEKNIIAYEHFGSTAVPGLAAKPIIDIMIVVRTLKKAHAYIPKLEKLGYAFWSENPDKDRLFFVKGLPPNGPRSHHVHIAEQNSPIHERLFFRDYLREHRNEAKAYAALKRSAARTHRKDREAYTDAKGAYVKRITRKAKRYFKKP